MQPKKSLHSHQSQLLSVTKRQVGGLTQLFNALESTPAAMHFVTGLPDKAEKSLNYSAIFDRTDKSITPFKSVRGLLLCIYTYNKN